MEFHRPRETWGGTRGLQFSAIPRGIHAARQACSVSLLLCACSLLTACAGTPIVTTASAGCSSLIPPSWEQGIAGAPLPADDSVGSWISFGDQQTGRLDQANSRTKDAIEIQRRCEDRDKAAVKKATRGFFGRLFG